MTKQANFYGVAAATNYSRSFLLMKEVTKGRTWSLGLIMTIYPQENPCTYSLKKNGSGAKENDKNNSKNINLFMYKNLCKI